APHPDWCRGDAVSNGPLHVCVRGPGGYVAVVCARLLPLCCGRGAVGVEGALRIFQILPSRSEKPLPAIFSFDQPQCSRVSCGSSVRQVAYGFERAHAMVNRAFIWAYRLLLVLTTCLMALGGATRAMDAGLACPDWPLCFGHFVPDFHPQVYF